MRYFISLWLFILLSSCASTMNNYYTDTVKSWRGGKAHALVKRWGMPEENLTTPTGDTLYIYKTESYHSNGSAISPQIGVNFRPNGTPVIVVTSSATSPGHRSLSLTCITAFLVNPQGIIKQTQVHDYGCYGNQGFAKTMGNPSKK